ncbi:hypothetical protein R1T16_06360 [Flavobacterium sp. DG1-102-2]|uniref:hypothetical protein n=1 Tax=Flavobacterium sp. DG1-102-2 TaxID=3081663 RepID=UPI002949A196|nr:hypothetical protein [Flavobacterium sp. DG1-102-2]MDV6168040.1 hypothetical protein [Flavobacterium sp. DG1-102-2]
MALKLRLLLLLAFFATASSWAQVTPAQKKDTVKKEDMYKRLENYSKRKKFTKFVHKLIFRPVTKQKPAESRQKVKAKTPEMLNDFGRYEGKIVRRIKVETMDPFGYSINDTTKQPNTWVEKFGNGVHLKTKQLTIRNLLLIKRDKPLDSLLVKESERLIRSQRYVRRVVIKPVPAGNSKDSVDIEVRVLDSWSLIPNGSFSGSRTTFEITERNFLGLGHEFRNDFDKRFNTGETSNLSRYTIPNIMNTYINATVNYEIWKSDNYIKSIGLERRFFSAYTKWAGGAYAESRVVIDSLPDVNKIWSMQTFKSDAHDLWAGYAFKIYDGESEEERTTRLVTTGRYFSQHYKERPSVLYDSVGYYSNEKLYMASVGLTSRKFVQDKFLFNYDIVEDIPIGKVYSLTAGMQAKNSERRMYLGGRYAFGNYYNWGYLSLNTELGTFYYKDKTQQTTLRLDLLYFTNIKDWGNWRFRHFIKPELVFGDNRMGIIKDQLNLNGDKGIQGFDTRTLLGTKKFVLTLQTQSYSPWNVFGFRLNPFANFSMGVIGDEQTKLYESKLYTKIGVGLLIYNDYLIFNSFQLSFAFYPSIPDQGSNIFKTNSFKNNDIELPDFQVAKPVVVPYE